MNIRQIASSLILSLSAASSMAVPVLIDFNQQTSTQVGNSLQISDFLISDDCAGLKNKTDCLVGQVAKKNFSLFNNYGGSVTRLSRVDGKAFDFLSIALDQYFNNGDKGKTPVEFSFNYMDKAGAKSTVKVDHKTGWEQFSFNQGLSLLSVSWTVKNSQWMRFDNISAQPTANKVPEPATLALTLLALGGLAYSRRNNKRG